MELTGRAASLLSAPLLRAGVHASPRRYVADSSTLKHALTASSHLPAVVPSHIEAFEEFNVARSAVGGCFREANPSIVRYKRFPALCEGIASTFFVLHANIERC